MRRILITSLSALFFMGTLSTPVFAKSAQHQEQAKQTKPQRSHRQNWSQNRNHHRQQRRQIQRSNAINSFNRSSTRANVNVSTHISNRVNQGEGQRSNRTHRVNRNEGQQGNRVHRERQRTQPRQANRHQTRQARWQNTPRAERAQNNTTQRRHNERARNNVRRYNAKPQAHQRNKPVRHRYRRHNQHYHPYGYRRSYFPSNHFRFSWHDSYVYLYGGLFYDYWGGHYVVRTPPIGLRINNLPEGVLAVAIGGLLYYVLNDVYYRPVDNAYVVVDPPTDSETGNSNSSVVSHSLFNVTYKNGYKDPAQQQRDHSGCDAWARDDTGFQGDGHGSSAGAIRYQHTWITCMEKRGYTVE